MFKAILLCGLCFTGLCVSASRRRLGHFTFTKEQQANRFFSAFERWERADRGRVVDPDAVLCVGSSSMTLWNTIHRDLAPLKIIHRGFGGSTMHDVLVFKDFFVRYGAGRIVVYEGDNDMAGQVTPEQFVEQCRQFVEYVHSLAPKTKIYFLSVKPSIRRQNIWEKFQTGNRLLKAFTETDKRLFYIDVATAMLNPDGSIRRDIFSSDMLHMNAKGYEIWTRVVRAALLDDTDNESAKPRQR